MKNVQLTLKKHEIGFSQLVTQPFGKTQTFAPVAEIRKDRTYRSTFPDRIGVDQHTGQIFMKAPGLDLMFPMLVVRHGQTDGNVRITFQGQIDIPESWLNEVGKEQAKQAAKRLYEQLEGFFGMYLKEFALSGKLIILKSPLSRAQDTAEAFLEYFERRTGITLDSGVEERLAEMDFGVLEGLTVEEIDDEELRELVLRYRVNQDATVDWKGTGESFLDLVMRATNLLEDLNAQYQGQDVLVLAFSHGMTINALRTAVGDKALLEENGLIAFRKHVLDNTEACWLGHSQQLLEQLFCPRTRSND